MPHTSTLRDTLGSFEHSIENVRVLVPCLGIRLYWDAVLASEWDELYAASRRLLGSDVTHYVTGAISAARPIDPAADTIVASWLTKPRELKLYDLQLLDHKGRGVSAARLMIWMIYVKPLSLLKGAAREQRRERLIKLHEVHQQPSADPVAVLDIRLPLHHAASNDPAILIDWLTSRPALQNASFAGGTVGWRIEMTDESLSVHDDGVLRQRSAALRSHAGFDNPNSLGFYQVMHWDRASRELVPRVPRPNWLTLVSRRSLNTRAGLQDALAKASLLTVIPCGDSVIVQAGAEPVIGGVQGGDLDAYRQAARVLEPLVAPSSVMEPSQLDRDAFDEWVGALRDD